MYASFAPCPTSRCARRLAGLVALTISLLAPGRLLADAGDLDCTFGVGGVVTHDLGSLEAVVDAHLQSDGNLVALGAGSGSLRLSRFLPDGALDLTFGSGGTIVHSLAGLDFVGSLAIDSLDRLLVGGMIVVPDGGSTDQEAFVARFTADGAFDATFGGGDGWTSFDFTAATASAGTEGITAVVVDASDRPIVGGSPDANGLIFNPSDRNMAVARLDTSGALDTTFDGDGIAVASSPGSATDDHLFELALDPLGRIVAIGFTWPVASPRDTMLVRWTTTGALDASFDSDGILIIDLSETGADDFGIDVDFGSAGTIVPLGVSGSPAVARLTESGALDTSFATDGILHQSFVGSQDVTEHVRVQSDDKILVTGWPVVSSGFHFAVMRFTALGALDSTWSSPDGVATVTVGGNERAYTAVLGPDEKILLAGGLNNDTDLVMARFLNDGQPNGPSSVTEILTDTPDPSLIGQTVNVTYEVTSTAGTPTGNVIVSDGLTSCTGTVADGSCSLAWGPTPGMRTLTAEFPGGGGVCPSSDTEPHTVLVPTVTFFTFLTPSSPVVGEPVTAAVSVIFNGGGGVGPVTGSVTLSDGAGASCVGVLVDGSTSCILTPTAAGSRNWTATFPGDGDFVASSGSTFFVVAPALTSAAITAATPDPSSVSHPVQVDVSIAAVPPGSGFPSGAVNIDDGAGATCIATLIAGQGSCILTPTVVGARNLNAIYGGDGNFGPISTIEPHQVIDDIAPRVVAVATAAGAAIDDCSTLRAFTAEIEVTFDEPVQQAVEAGRYRVLAAGPDADLSTSTCSGTQGDDIRREIMSVSSDLDPTTPTLSLILDNRLPTGLVRLIVCEAVEDLAGNPLDGNGDGTGGDPFVTTFRVAPLNLFANGDFDRCPVTLFPWIESATAPNVVLPSESEDADASALSGSAQLSSSTAPSTALGQCIELPASEAHLELALRARLDAIGAATATLDLACSLFDLAACAGASLGVETMTTPLPDLAGAWSAFVLPFAPSPTAVSALCSATVTADDPGEASFDAYLDGLTLINTTIFADGFDSGNTQAWTRAVAE